MISKLSRVLCPDTEKENQISKNHDPNFTVGFARESTTWNRLDCAPVIDPCLFLFKVTHRFILTTISLASTDSQPYLNASWDGALRPTSSAQERMKALNLNILPKSYLYEDYNEYLAQHDVY